MQPSCSLALRRAGGVRNFGGGGRVGRKGGSLQHSGAWHAAGQHGGCHSDATIVITSIVKSKYIYATLFYN